MYNIDLENNVRFGVISLNDIDSQEWYEMAEPVYPPNSCPKCSNDRLLDLMHTDLFDSPYSAWNCEKNDFDYADYGCEDCEYLFSEESSSASEPYGWLYEENGYKITQDRDDSDLFIVKSPFATFRGLCSPCAPNAGHLMSEGSYLTYCLDKLWFIDSKPPYEYHKLS